MLNYTCCGNSFTVRDLAFTMLSIAPYRYGLVTGKASVGSGMVESGGSLRDSALGLLIFGLCRDTRPDYGVVMAPALIIRPVS